MYILCRSGGVGRLSCGHVLWICPDNVPLGRFVWLGSFGPQLDLGSVVTALLLTLILNGRTVEHNQTDERVTGFKNYNSRLTVFVRQRINLDNRTELP